MPILPEGEAPAPVRLLDVEDILKLIPVSKRTFNDMERKGLFPKGKKIGGGLTSKRTWIDTVVFRWIAEHGEALPAE
jgi:predicted DNA-binding transcriptional regulator AlpA